ncbi:MAG: hypothetical protein RLZZ450_6482, partial [Pseudomonadota bacterium]
MAEENTPGPDASPDPELGASELPVSPRAPEAALAPDSEGGAVPPAAAPSAPAATGKAGALTPGQRLAAKKAQKAVEKREFKEEIKVREEEKRQKEEAEADRLLGGTAPTPVLPAEVEQAARTFSDFLHDHRDKILMTLGALATLAAVVFGAQRFLRSGAAEHAAQLGRALEIANGAIDADDADGKADDGKPVFKTEHDRATKALAAFDEAVKGGGDAEAATWAKL